MNIQTAKNSPEYVDFYFRSVAIIVACHFIVTFGMAMTFFEFFASPDYWKAMIGSVLIASVLFAWVNAVSTKLDRKFDWLKQALARIGLQAFWGLVIPSIFAFAMAALYFFIRGRNIFDTLYISIDFPVIVLLILLINVYYFCYYAVNTIISAHNVAVRHRKEADLLLAKASRLETERTRLADAAKRAAEETERLTEELRSKAVEGSLEEIKLVSSANDVPIMLAGPGIKPIGKYMVNKATKSIPISITDIAYFFREQEVNYLLTSEGEKYMISETLDAVMIQLPPESYFRANRQFIVNRTAVIYFEALENYKLKLFVKPTCKDHIIISQKSVKRFKEWIKG